MVKSERELFKVWKKYIDIPMFRIVPTCDYKEILKEGINPKKCPYKKIKSNVIQLERIVRKLEDKGFVIFLKWRHRKVSGTHAMDVTLADLSLGCVDFTPDEKLIPYYLALQGGAANANLRKIIKRIRESNFELSEKEIKVIKNIEIWTKKRTCNNKAFYVKGNSKSFETALFQVRRRSKSKIWKKPKKELYLKSPFGSFESFKKVIIKQGLRKYLHYLKNKRFFLRVKGKIPKEEIVPL